MKKNIDIFDKINDDNKYMPFEIDSFILPEDLDKIKSGKFEIDEYIGKELTNENMINEFLIIKALEEYIKNTYSNCSEKDIIGDLSDIPEHGSYLLDPVKKLMTKEETAKEFESFIERRNANLSYLNARYEKCPILQKINKLLIKVHTIYKGVDKLFKENEVAIIINNLDKLFGLVYHCTYISNGNINNLSNKKKILLECDKLLKETIPLINLAFDLKYVNHVNTTEILIKIDEIGSMIGGWIRYIYNIIKTLNEK